MKQALLVIDIQNDYFKGGLMELVGAEKAADNAKTVISKFRREKLPVIYIQHVASRPEAGFFLPDTEGVKINERVKPLEDEKVIVKHFPNSFIRTGLQEHLDSLGITDITIVGMMTHMCVDATVRAARDMGYNTVVVGDACATRDLIIDGDTVKAEEVQKSFLAALNHFYSTVKSTNEI
ncbi:cysteine hydrolase family protein [Seleniivibrio woodruffii]|uniref:cysteine hydrolase family protein n=1 Tax=Seleniivibrio woodruffii TaxID=1078050 RepID=UPI002409C63B|nr:cysteine hydrolase family protein [Seleniivibrio woodruffii]